MAEPAARWTYEEAALVIIGLKARLKFNRKGWMVTLGGSVSWRGHGRDLDLMFLPIYLDADTQWGLVEWLAQGWVIINRPHFDTTHRWLQVVFEDEAGRWIDCAFWRGPNDELKIQSWRDAQLEDAIIEAGGMGV